MKIRKAKLSDVNVICRLGNAVEEFEVAEKTVNFWPRKILVSCLKSKNAFVLVSKNEKNRVNGFIIASYNSCFRKAIIENIFVSRESRNKGTGKKLLNELIKKLRKINCEYVCTLIKNDDEQALGFYIANDLNMGTECIWLDKTLSKTFKK